MIDRRLNDCVDECWDEESISHLFLSVLFLQGFGITFLMDWCKYTYVNRWMKSSETIQKYAGQRQITIYEDGGNMVCLHMDHLDDYERKDFPKQRNQYQKNGGRGKKLS